MAGFLHDALLRLCLCVCSALLMPVRVSCLLKVQDLLCLASRVCMILGSRNAASLAMLLSSATAYRSEEHCISWFNKSESPSSVARERGDKWAFPKWDCVMQPVHVACGPQPKMRAAERKVCVPIEPISQVDPRKRLWKHLTTFEREFVLKPRVSVLPNRFPRAIYIDVGANAYNTSIREFLNFYPNMESFTQIIAFEGDSQHFASYEGRNVELIPHPAWTSNTTLAWIKRKGHTGNGLGSLKDGSGAVNTKIATVDLADFLKRRLREEDYVVLKMDVEGAEYEIVPHLLATGTTSLIDEFFVEVHTLMNDCCSHKKRDDAVRLLNALRLAGVYVHDWG